MDTQQTENTKESTILIKFTKDTIDIEARGVDMNDGYSQAICALTEHYFKEIERHLENEDPLRVSMVKSGQSLLLTSDLTNTVGRLMHEDYKKNYSESKEV